MTKRRLYAVAEFGAVIVILALVFSPAAPLHAAMPQNGTCPGCIALSIPVDAAIDLPAQLDGREVFVRMIPGSATAILDALDGVERKGGRPALSLEVPGESVPPADTLRKVGRVLLDTAAWQGEDPDAFAFALKRRLTSIRAAIAPSTPLGLAVDGRTLSMLMPRELGSYVDFVVATDAISTPVAGIELWRTIPGTPASVQEVLEMTRTPDTTHWLWRLPQDRAVSSVLAAELTRL